MEPKDIKTYISEHIRSGKTKHDIHEQLSAVGWSDDEIDAAYAQALIETGVPIPQEGNRGAYAKKSSAVEVVINFFSFILLGIVVFAVGSLYFGVIEYFFPDTLTMSEWRIRSMQEAIHYSTAALIVGFPLLVISLRLWFKKFREDEGKVESKLSKWLTYLVLLVASVTIVGDLIAILNEFLQGEISVRFFLKGLTILVLAGTVFGFYFLERKKIQYRKEIPRKTFQMFGWGLFGFIAIGIIFGFVAGGTPETVRKQTFDQQRANDLSQLTTCIAQYARENQSLPTSLEDLDKTTTYSRCNSREQRDPETQEQYEYTVLTTLENTESGILRGTYELCATFSLSTIEPGKDTPMRNYSKWDLHEAGRSCDTEVVNVKVDDTQAIIPQVRQNVESVPVPVQQF